MNPIKDCQEFISALEKAVKDKDKKQILALYDANEVNWDDVIDFMAEHYDELVDQANEILGI
mgnify:FL=1